MRALAAAAILVAAQPAVHAQDLQDPTRPPAQFSPRAGGSATVSTLPQLQSVLIARQAGGRQLAVIDGETVRLGQSFRGARLVRVAQNEVELLRGHERQVLKLYAAATPAARRGSATTTGREQE